MKTKVTLMLVCKNKKCLGKLNHREYSIYDCEKCGRMYFLIDGRLRTLPKIDFTIGKKGASESV